MRGEACGNDRDSESGEEKKKEEEEEEGEEEEREKFCSLVACSRSMPYLTLTCRGGGFISHEGRDASEEEKSGILR